jgi:hypothetical protein
MDSEKQKHVDESGDQLRREIHSVITRYSQESDVSTWEVIGALEAVKMDLWDGLEKYHDR